MKYIQLTLAAGALMLSLAACSDNDDTSNDPVVNPGGNTFVDFTSRAGSPDLMYKQNNGEWSQCYDPAADGSLTFGGVNFTHHGEVGQWGPYWQGFCPSNSSENADHSDADWLDWQWSNITGKGVYVNQALNWVSASGAPFMVAHWDSMEMTTGIPTAPSLKVQAADRSTRFVLKGVWITNSTYNYYLMKDGSGYNEKFGADDWCKVYIYGVKGLKRTGPVEVSLYDGSKEENRRYLKEWTFVSDDVAKTLGEVDYIYFQMASSDSGEWGMNNPAYFCVGGLVLEPVL